MKFYSRLIISLVFLISGCGGNSGNGLSASSYTVTTSGDGHESISPNTPQTVNPGATQSFTVSPNSGYTLSNTVSGTCPAGSWAASIYTTGAITGSCTVSFSAINPNAPWYPSINAFEDYDSGRSHLFAQATFAGDFTGGNTVNVLASTASYPSVSNMAYVDANQVYAYGGGHGNQAGSIGSFIAKVDPTTLASVWNTQLVDTSVSGEWDYPGAASVLDDGFLYVVYGYRLSKVNRDTGAVIATVVLPTGGALPGDTAYNGFNATPDGILVMKSTHRQAGCTIQGPDALLNCPDPTDIPLSVLVSVDPQTMTVLHQTTLAVPTFGKMTVGTYLNQRYAYLSGSTTWLRYAISNSGDFTLDASWNPGTLMLTGQTSGNGLVLMNGWVVGQTNGTPSTTALSVVAVSQANAANQFSIQPFLGDPIPPLNATAFSPSISWAPSSISADAGTNIVYATDALPGKLAAIILDSNGFNLVWIADQATTEAIAIIGSQAQRIIVGTDIPNGEIPGNNSNDYVVWRNAVTGAEIARSPLLPQMTPGSMVQPYYSGDMFYGGVTGTLHRLTPTH